MTTQAISPPTSYSPSRSIPVGRTAVACGGHSCKLLRAASPLPLRSEISDKCRHRVSPDESSGVAVWAAAPSHTACATSRPVSATLAKALRTPTAISCTTVVPRACLSSSSLTCNNPRYKAASVVEEDNRMVANVLTAWTRRIGQARFLFSI